MSASSGPCRRCRPAAGRAASGRKYAEDHATSMASCSAPQSGRQQPGCCHAYGRKGHPHPGQHALPRDPPGPAGERGRGIDPVAGHDDRSLRCSRRATSGWPAGVSLASTSSTLVIAPAARFGRNGPFPQDQCACPALAADGTLQTAVRPVKIRVPVRPVRYIMLTSAERRQR